MRRESVSDRLARYAVQPLGSGSYGIYDKAARDWLQTFKGRGAMQRANRRWRALVGAS
jgi:hypothetical protein